MKRTLLLSFALVVGLATLAQAQIIQPRRGYRPIAWTSIGVGWAQLRDICDPETRACWTFGGAPQFRATLEWPLGTDATLGVAGTMARMPLFWADNGLLAGGCGGCDADVNVNQLFGNFRLGGGNGFHQVVDLVAGATMFQNFRRLDGTRLGPGKTITDMTFGLGVGLGYGLSSRAHFVITQEWALVVHERQPGNPTNTAQQQTIRIGARFGLGDR